MAKLMKELSYTMITFNTSLLLDVFLCVSEMSKSSCIKPREWH